MAIRRCSIGLPGGPSVANGHLLAELTSSVNLFLHPQLHRPLFQDPTMQTDGPTKVPLRHGFIILFSIAALIFFIYTALSLNPNMVIPQSMHFLQWNSAGLLPNMDNQTDEDFGTNDVPLILVWTNFFSDVWRGLIPIFGNCPPSQHCNLTFDRSLINQSSVIMFHIRNLAWSDIPPQSTRRPYQYYVFALWESPHHTNLDLSKYPGFFNLTATYRRDSDCVWPYGNFVRTPNSSSQSDLQLEKVVTGKTKLMAWFVSNCQTTSRREVFVRNLQKVLPVDIYGDCGTMRCVRGGDGNQVGLQDASPCQKLLTKDYKFYLSLENSLCRDYVTEKLYSILDNSLVVPVVLERKVVIETVEDTEAAQALNKSIIAADDFPTIQALADFLRYLDRNVTEYLRYFEWRRSFQIQSSSPGCELCALVRKKPERRIDDIRKWWNDEAKCHRYT